MPSSASSAAASHQDPASVTRLFAGIASRYDLANHLLSGGMDFYWRRVTSSRVAATSPKLALDLATGSGDLLRRLQRDSPQTSWIGADFCRPMLEQARLKGIGPLVHADALHLPFEAAKFDAITVAFGLRNMQSYPAALTEFARVLRPGGMLAVLDFSMPEGWLGGFYRFYLHRILPLIAGIVAGDRSAYEYLGDSIEQFPRGQAMLDLMGQSGFCSQTAHPMTFGVVTLYLARKAPCE